LGGGVIWKNVKKEPERSMRGEGERQRNDALKKISYIKLSGRGTCKREACLFYLREDTPVEERGQKCWREDSKRSRVQTTWRGNETFFSLKERRFFIGDRELRGRGRLGRPAQEIENTPRGEELEIERGLPFL